MVPGTFLFEDPRLGDIQRRLSKNDPDSERGLYRVHPRPWWGGGASIYQNKGLLESHELPQLHPKLISSREKDETREGCLVVTIINMSSRWRARIPDQERQFPPAPWLSPRGRGMVGSAAVVNDEAVYSFIGTSAEQPQSLPLRAGVRISDAGGLKESNFLL